MKLSARIAPPAALPLLLTLFATVALAGPVGPWYVGNNIDTSGSAFLSQLQSINWNININTSPGSIAVVNVGGSFFDPPATVDTLSAIDPFAAICSVAAILAQAPARAYPHPHLRQRPPPSIAPEAPQAVPKQP